MKKILLLLTIGIFIGNMSFSQNAYSAAQKETADKITQRMNTDLNLEQNQFQKVEALNLELVKRFDAAKKIPDMEKMQGSIRAINSYRDKELNKILTPQQLKKLNNNENGRKCDPIK